MEENLLSKRLRKTDNSEYYYNFEGDAIFFGLLQFTVLACLTYYTLCKYFPRARSLEHPNFHYAMITGFLLTYAFMGMYSFFYMAFYSHFE